MNREREREIANINIDKERKLRITKKKQQRIRNKTMENMFSLMKKSAPRSKSAALSSKLTIMSYIQTDGRTDGSLEVFSRINSMERRGLF